ncbi:MAG: FtsB family cell division protein [Ilumatobacteraceae bacterium]
MNFPLVVANRLRPFTTLFILVGLVALTVTFLVMPIRTWMNQRDLLDMRSTKYGVYEEVNDALQDEIDALSAPEGVRQAIRSQLGYLLPNERRIPLLAQPEAPITLPDRWPYTMVAGIVSVRESQNIGVEQGNLDTFNPLRPKVRQPLRP